MNFSGASNRELEIKLGPKLGRRPGQESTQEAETPRRQCSEAQTRKKYPIGGKKGGNPFISSLGNGRNIGHNNNFF